MGIAEWVWVFTIFGFMQAVLAHQIDQYGIEGQTPDASEGFVVDDLDNIVDLDKPSLRSGDDSQEEGSLSASMPGAVPCSINCGPKKIPQQNLYCHGWPIIGQIFPCPGGFGQCVTYCINCGQPGNRPPNNYVDQYNNNGIYYIPGQIKDNQNHHYQWIYQPTNNHGQPPINIGGPGSPDYISNNGHYVVNNGGGAGGPVGGTVSGIIGGNVGGIIGGTTGGSAGIGGSYVMNVGGEQGGVVVDGNGAYINAGGGSSYIIDGNGVLGGGSFIKGGGDPSGVVLDGNGAYINGGGGGGGSYIIDGNGVYGPNGCITTNGNCGNNGVQVGPPSYNSQKQTQSQVQNQNSGQQSQSQSQTQTQNGGGGRQSQSQSQNQNQVGRVGSPLSAERNKHAVRNNIRLRIFT